MVYGIDAGISLQEKLNDIGAAVHGGEHERCGPILKDMHVEVEITKVRFVMIDVYGKTVQSTLR